MRYGIKCTVTVVLLAASGCERSTLSEQRNSEQPAGGAPWLWAKAPDNSVVNYSKTFDIEITRRCWLRQSGYDCLYLLRNGDWYQAQRYQMAELNRGEDDDPILKGKRGGYSCLFTRSGIVEEAIAGAGDYLTKNMVTLYRNSPTPPWAAEYVAAFMRDNAIDWPRTHFDCTELAGQVLSSSVETVGSTSISHAQLMK